MMAIQATISPTPGPGCPEATVCRDQTANNPAALATAEPAKATQANAQRRVNNASIEKPTPKTSASQANTRDGSATAAAPEPCVANSTSHPRTLPVCGRMNDPISTNTRMATTKALAPGSISRAIRRSAASISSRKASNAPRFGSLRLIACTQVVPRPRPVSRCPACRDRHRCDVARAHLLSAGREMHQAAVARAPAHPRGAAVLAAFPGGHQRLNGPPDLVAVLLQRDLVLQGDQSLVTFLHDGFRQLTVQVGGGGARAFGVLEGERTR